MKKLTLNQMEATTGGIRCAFDFTDTRPNCAALFMAFAAAAAGANFNGAFQICSVAHQQGCTVSFE